MVMDIFALKKLQCQLVSSVLYAANQAEINTNVRTSLFSNTFFLSLLFCKI